MKKHMIFITIAIVSTVLTFGIPQFKGRAFVSNDNEREPKDWLSEQVLKHQKVASEKNYNVPANIRVIKFYGNDMQRGYDYHVPIFVDQGKKQRIKYEDSSHLSFEVTADTLKVVYHAEYMRSVAVYIDTNVTGLVFDKMIADVHINRSSPLWITLENRSDVAVRGNRNRHLSKMTVKGESTLKLRHCFTPVIDMQVENSMVYVDPLNNIDSLKANLVGKSNIKTSNTLPFETDDFYIKILMQEFNLAKTNVNIYPSGNTSYYRDVTSATK